MSSPGQDGLASPGLGQDSFSRTFTSVAKILTESVPFQITPVLSTLEKCKNIYYQDGLLQVPVSVLE